ncbi:MAG: response regulator transcription factor [Alphaproteobacteria bacterium]|nr:response regulator transcription factor [Alphaproteobacteria bacterium]
MQSATNKLLLVEDDRALAADLSEALSRRGWSVTGALGLAAARSALGREGFDLVLLDLSLPDGNGMELLAGLRTERAGTTPPVIVITAQDDLVSRVTGLGSGADDYLTKPFPVEELDARIRAVLRRAAGAGGQRLLIENVAIDAAAGIVTIDGEPAGFTPREAMLLALLARHLGTVVARTAVVDAVFAEKPATTAALEVLVHRLRRRLADAHARVALHTIKGIGYLLVRAA